MKNIVDLPLSKQLAANNPETAEALLRILFKSLPNELALIREAYQHQHYQALQYQVHSLLGALCYCGVPELKAKTMELHHALKHHEHHQLECLFVQFEKAAQDVLEALAKLIAGAPFY